MRRPDVKIPGIGRVALRNPVYHESSGNGIGRVDSFGGSAPRGHLQAEVFRADGTPKKASEVMSLKDRFWNNVRGNATKINLGSGLVTNVGVLAMANDWNVSAASAAPTNILKLANYHVSGTGVTAAAATDIKIQTISTNGGQTPVAGSQSLISAANLQKYQTVATISYTGSEAVTEWGLITSSTYSATTGTPATATSATSLTATGTPFTASSTSVQGQQQHIVATGTTAVYGYITSNTTSVLTIPAWYKTADGTAGSTPGSTEAYTLYSVMWDHKVFSAVNVNNGDSIQFTYTLTINSGG